MEVSIQLTVRTFCRVAKPAEPSLGDQRRYISKMKAVRPMSRMWKGQDPASDLVGAPTVWDEHRPGVLKFIDAHGSLDSG